MRPELPRVFVTLLVFIFAGSGLRAQESGSIQGLVLEAGSSVRIGSVNVHNRQTRNTVSTDPQGVFRIFVQVGDTLVLSKVGYETHTTVIHTLSDILIDLHAVTHRIETVTIEQKSRETELRDGMDAYRRQGVYSEGKPSVLQYVFNPLTALYERFSRTGKNARRFRNYMDRELEAMQVDRMFNAYKITELTGLEDEDLRNFSIIYRPTYEQVQYWNEYDLMKYVMDSYKKFEADGRPEAPRLLPDLDKP